MGAATSSGPAMTTDPATTALKFPSGLRGALFGIFKTRIMVVYLPIIMRSDAGGNN